MATNLAKRTAIAAVSVVSLLGGALSPASAAPVAKSATAEWLGDAGQTVAMSSKTLGCNGCKRSTLTLVSGPKELTATKSTRNVRDTDGNRRTRVTYRVSSDIAGVYVYDLKVWPGLKGKPTFTTRWTLTFRGDPMIALPNQEYTVSQSENEITLQDVKIATNSSGARSYEILAEENTAGCSIPAGTTKVKFLNPGHCKVKANVAADGVYRAASTVATITVKHAYTYTVTVYGWVQRTKSTYNDIYLSNMRARAVRNYLISQGITVTKFNIVRGRGVKGSTATARQARVVISWTGDGVGTKATTVYFSAMSFALNPNSKSRLRALIRMLPNT